MGERSVAGGKIGAADGLDLLVLLGGKLTTHRLPAQGSVSIGRSEENDVCIDDPSVSRRHAILHLGASMRIEDLGSANGIRLRDRSRPESGERRDVTEKVVTVGVGAGHEGRILPLKIGDLVSLGAATLVVRHIEAARTTASPEQAPGDTVVGEASMRKLYALAERVAQGTISVILLGETGTGKEVLASYIHARSPRANRSLLCLNCAALSETLLESELFGHEKGAFTGAVQSKPGLLETADGGTVFLDEVGELPAATQVKLLRVLEERRMTRVGGLSARTIDVRFIAATNRDLDAEVKRGAFRQDLSFRLNGITLRIPPLRERVSEIEPLARLFGARAAASLGRAAPRLAPGTVAALERHAWPGNVRELRNVMERAMVLGSGETILPEHLLLTEPESSPGRPASRDTAPAGTGDLRDELVHLERQRILDALEACGGNQTHAAARLGMPRRTFVTRLDEYGIKRPRKGRS